MEKILEVIQDAPEKVKIPCLIHDTRICQVHVDLIMTKTSTDIIDLNS